MYSRSFTFLELALVSPSDWRLPLALEAIQGKLSPRIRGKCLQSAYKVASGFKYLNSDLKGLQNLLDWEIRPTLVERQIDLLLSLSCVCFEVFHYSRLAVRFRGFMYSVETTFEGASP